MAKTQQVTDEQLEEAYCIMAKLIHDYGDKYLPVFKRLHEEKITWQANRALVDIALQVVQQKLR